MSEASDIREQEDCPDGEVCEWSCDQHERSPGPCYRCGKDPAEGFASTWTAAEGERWYCHGDDDDVTCYMIGDAAVEPDAFGFAGFLLRPPTDG